MSNLSAELRNSDREKIIPSNIKNKVLVLSESESNPYPCWWRTKQTQPKPSTALRISGNQTKNSGSSEEFQSLKLDSTDDLKFISASFGVLMDQELTKRYKELAASPPKDFAEPKSVPSSDDENAPEHFLTEQAVVFDQMKEFLLAQQMCLKQNLEMLHANASFPKRDVTLPEGRHTNLMNNDELFQNEELRSSGEAKHWGSSTGAKSNEIQICPVCGVEFEMSENPIALEDHVASHWSSSEPL